MSRRMICPIRAIVVGALLVWCSIVACAAEPDSVGVETARKYVPAALKYEADGQNDYRNILLREARKAAPDYAPVNWHSARLKYDGRWRSVREAQNRARQDKRLSVYRYKRDRCPDTALGHTDLACWCRDQQLAEQARIHWSRALHHAPRHKEAMSELGLREVQGVLLTQEQIERRRLQEREFKRVTQQWQTDLAAWRRDIEEGSPESRDVALARLRAVRDVRAIPALERVFSNQSEDLAREVVAILARMPNSQSTHSLVRHAVLSDYEDVRALATEQLRARPLHDFAPLLLNNLTTPIQTRFHIVGQPGRFHYQHEFYLERPLEDVHWTTSQTQEDYFTFLGPGKSISRLWWGGVPPQSIDAVRTARQTESKLRTRNEKAAALNKRVQTVLATVTGQQLDNEPRDWWNWWVDYNELYVPDTKPVRKVSRWMYTAVTRVGVTSSCFQAGTLVWTETGLAKIEAIRPGDRVLSQDPETGELALKIVLTTTVRPPAELLRVNVEGEEIFTTKGHPFWVASKGWRMAKFVQEGQHLHGLPGGLFVEAVQQIEKKQEAFNLIVEDFATYFVGNLGVLVHDNTLRMPTRAVVPGYVPE